jgi:ATP-binding cassette subfamily F protein uup
VGPARAAREISARRRAAESSPPKPRKLTLAEKQELAVMEDRILEAEDQVATLEAHLNDPDFQQNHFEEVPQAVAKLDSAKAEVERLYARWEELGSLPS